MDSVKKKRIIEKSIIIFIALIVIGLIVFFFSDVFIPFIKLEIAQDLDGAKELLISKGFVGYLTVSFVEGLQMVVVFISAEFIQITSGMSYPWWLAIILCDCGVMIGSSIIYLLVNVFKFDSSIFSKKKKIEKYESMTKTKSAVILMYVLFIMPIIPFGAICYYGANKKIPYFRYLFTCATGVIPSIITSIMMGTAIKEFISKSLPIWALVLVIILAAAILFVLLAFVLKKYFINPTQGRVNPFFLSIAENLCKFISFFKVKSKIINKEAIDNLDGPFICIVNHHSMLDIFALPKLLKDKNMITVCNEYYFRIPIIGKLLTKAGHIKKKMFYKDLSCVKNMMITLKDGFPIVIFPEGRLSNDGGPSTINDSIAHFCKKVGVPVVLIQIRNSYLCQPKWRKKAYRSTIEVEVTRVLSSEEVNSLDKQELHSIICNNLNYIEFNNKNINFKQKDKAKGLHNILYLCPECKTYYSNISYGNTLKCTCCNKEYTLDNKYMFSDDKIKNIYEYYGKIKDIERENLDNINLSIPVDVKIFKDDVKGYKTEEGVFTLTNEKLSYKSNVSDLYFEYTIFEQEGLAYSVNEEFELYYDDCLYYFYPKMENKTICTRVALLFELLKERTYEE